MSRSGSGPIVDDGKVQEAVHISDRSNHVFTLHYDEEYRNLVINRTRSSCRDHRTEQLRSETWIQSIQFEATENDALQG